MHRLPSLLILAIACIALVVLSLCPWERWTGGKLKDFNLLGDIMPPKEYAQDVSAGVADNIDPELTKIAGEVDTAAKAIADTVLPEAPVIPEIPSDFTAPRINGAVAIEDYSADGLGIERLKERLGEASARNVRIAMVGDSYIEGDILAQDIRAGLQDRFGGRGVGYMAAFSAFPGFRSSVNQAASGWQEHEIRKMKDDPLRTILGTYFTATEGANTHFRKSVKPAHLDSWDRTRIVFRADSSGTITLTGPETEYQTFDVAASREIQAVTLTRTVGDVRFTTTIPGIEVLGFWLEGTTGIVLDGISLRGNSGVSHRTLNAATTAQMRQYVDYDLIILEFGMNALSASQTNYNAYANAMVDVVNNLKRLYPNAQVLVLGVGDRGQKQGTEVVSMPTATALIRAQRDVARRTGSLFWDTREAMGGRGAAVDWNERHLLNSDYVHLNHKGGKALADIFLHSLDNTLNQ